MGLFTIIYSGVQVYDVGDKMIGQKVLLGELRRIIEDGTFPRFSIILGENGSQSGEVVKYISDLLHAHYMKLEDLKADTIRHMVSTAYEQTSPIVYGICDADNMSLQAKNSLLKVTEEPPNKAYFVMTLEDTENTLHTILSRATIFKMDRCTPEEIAEYSGFTEKSILDIVKGVCTTPGDVDILEHYQIFDFYRYVDEFINSIVEVEGAKSFTLADKVAIKDDEDKYDIRLFFKMFQHICLEYAKKESDKGDAYGVKYYCDGVIRAGKSLKDLRVKGINKQMLMDEFVLDLRKLWR